MLKSNGNPTASVEKQIQRLQEENAMYVAALSWIAAEPGMEDIVDRAMLKFFGQRLHPHLREDESDEQSNRIR